MVMAAKSRQGAGDGTGRIGEGSEEVERVDSSTGLSAGVEHSRGRR